VCRILSIHGTAINKDVLVVDDLFTNYYSRTHNRPGGTPDCGYYPVLPYPGMSRIEIPPAVIFYCGMHAPTSPETPR
jgi:hypothetical protein